MAFDDYDSKDIYLRKGSEIIGLHSIGIAGPYTYTLTEMDGSEVILHRDFNPMESWGNEYDEEFNMLGRGSFRIFGFIEDCAAELEADGWVKFERIKV